MGCSTHFACCVEFELDAAWLPPDVLEALAREVIGRSRKIKAQIPRLAKVVKSNNSLSLFKPQSNIKW